VTSQINPSEGDVKFISLEQAKRYSIVCRPKQIFIIGGGQIYKQLLPLCKRVYVTKIYKKHENIDAFFPNLDETDEWKATPVSDVQEYNDISYQFWVYERV
jgi:dihydrofolate reductase